MNEQENNYSSENEMPLWQKIILTKRIEEIKRNPNSLKPIIELLDELDRDMKDS